MEPFEVESNLNYLDELVYQGIWENYGGPKYSRWIWTLPDLQGVTVLACLALLFTLSQSRTWCILRYLILQRKKSVRLHDQERSEPLENLSQATAIFDFLPLARNCLVRCCFRTPSHPTESSGSDCSIISPVFGICAILNVCLFVALGVASPLLLSEGSFGSTVVRSRMTEDCLNRTHSSRHTYSLQKERGIFQMCLNQINNGCENPYYLQSPHITKQRMKECPFPGPICFEDIDAFEITHWNITSLEIGLNSRSRLTLDRRLSCAPVHLEPFLLFDVGLKNRTSIHVGNTEMISSISDLELNIYHPNDMFLNTKNGPNFASSEDSGWRMGEADGPYDINILPRPWSICVGAPHGNCMNSNLQQQDGQSFLVVHRGGRSNAVTEIDDPLFAAHNRIKPGSNMKGVERYPDHEATALGCVEQFQYCAHYLNFCTSWGLETDQSSSVRRFLEMKKVSESISEIGLIEKAKELLSVYYYLAWSAEDSVPLTQMSPWILSPTAHSAKNDQWVIEVETWFIKTLVSELLSTRSAAIHDLKGPEDVFDSTCHRVLYRSNKYTNINLVGFLVTTGSLILLCIASLFMEWINVNTRKSVNCLASIISVSLRRLVLGTAALGTLVFYAGLQFWNSFLISVTRRYINRILLEFGQWRHRNQNRTSDFDGIEPTAGAISLESSALGQ